MKTIYEPGKHIPIVDEADVCVLGGSCTGVFAAVRAARLGAKVVIIEKQNCFGGVATLGLVNIWHSLYDSEFKKQIISGLTEEVVERLEKRSAVQRISNSPSSGFNLNTEELKIELDQLITESNVKPYLHSFYAAPCVEGDTVKAVIIENKSGRQAIAAKVFIDATGDGPVDAAFNCVKMLFPHQANLQVYQVHAVTEGTDAQATVSVRLEEEGRIVTGSSADTDTIVASTKAYINALNRLIIRRQKTAPGEDVKTVSYHGE